VQRPGECPRRIVVCRIIADKLTNCTIDAALCGSHSAIQSTLDYSSHNSTNCNSNPAILHPYIDCPDYYTFDSSFCAVCRSTCSNQYTHLHSIYSTYRIALPLPVLQRDQEQPHVMSIQGLSRPVAVDVPRFK